MAHRSIAEQFTFLNTTPEHERNSVMQKWALKQFQNNAEFNPDNFCIKSKSEYVEEQINNLPIVDDETPEAHEARRQEVITKSRTILRKRVKERGFMTRVDASDALRHGEKHMLKVIECMGPLKVEILQAYNAPQLALRDGTSFITLNAEGNALIVQTTSNPASITALRLVGIPIASIESSFGGPQNAFATPAHPDKLKELFQDVVVKYNNYAAEEAARQLGAVVVAGHSYTQAQLTMMETAKLNIGLKKGCKRKLTQLWTGMAEEIPSKLMMVEMFPNDNIGQKLHDNLMNRAKEYLFCCATGKGDDEKITGQEAITYCKDHAIHDTDAGKSTSNEFYITSAKKVLQNPETIWQRA